MADAGAFTRHADPDGNTLLVVVVYNAGWHGPHIDRIAQCAAPLPAPHAPRSCNPPIREADANGTFDTLADLRRRATRRCQWLADEQTTAQSATGFH